MLGIVKSLTLLKKLEDVGCIKLHQHTGKIVYWNGSSLRAFYIDDYTSSSFAYKGKDYVVKYVSGCFYPYVFRVND